MPERITDWHRAVKAMMDLKGISYSKMANDLGITRPYLSSMVNGRVRSEKLEKQISDYLGIPYADFTLCLEFKPKEK